MRLFVLALCFSCFCSVVLLVASQVSHQIRGERAAASYSPPRESFTTQSQVNRKLPPLQPITLLDDSGPYQPNWQSIDSRPIPEWYQDAKFGIFIHYGLYSVPSWGTPDEYAEWYGYFMTVPDSPFQSHHNSTYGADFKYEDFVAMWKAELFNATAWAELFKRSGAQYVVPTSKHHEGLTLWQSSTAWNWNSVDIGPKKDFVREILTAVKEQGLKAGVYLSLYEWFNPLYNSDDMTVKQQYVSSVLLPQFHELVTTYSPDMLWCDGAWDWSSSFWRSPEVIAWIYNNAPNKDTIVLNDRWGNDTVGVHGGIYTVEYGQNIYLNHTWELNMGIDHHSYGFNRRSNIDQYFSTSELLNALVRSVANNGNLLLDVGPAADGTIPVVMQQRLAEMGDWLSVNGEAIYGSRIWRFQQEGGDIDNATVRYTATKDQSIVYAHLLQWPGPVGTVSPSSTMEYETYVILEAPIPSANTVITLLGYANGEPLKWQPVDVIGFPGILVFLPDHGLIVDTCKWIYVLKMTNIL